MKTQKLSLANIQGRLSRAEMKKIMAGSGSGSGAAIICYGYPNGNCVPGHVCYIHINGTTGKCYITGGAFCCR